jgi:hypothetical protein
MQRTGDGQVQVRYSVAGRSGGRVTLFVVCTVHKETMSTGFLVEPQNQGRRFGDLGIKITVTVSCFGSQKPSSLRFIGCTTKPI